jgi:flagellar biosynthesis component FlhA
MENFKISQNKSKNERRAQIRFAGLQTDRRKELEAAQTSSKVGAGCGYVGAVGAVLLVILMALGMFTGPFAIAALIFTIAMSVLGFKAKKAADDKVNALHKAEAHVEGARVKAHAKKQNAQAKEAGKMKRHTEKETRKGRAAAPGGGD